MYVLGWVFGFVLFLIFVAVWVTTPYPLTPGELFGWLVLIGIFPLAGIIDAALGGRERK